MCVCVLTGRGGENAKRMFKSSVKAEGVLVVNQQSVSSIKKIK